MVRKLALISIVAVLVSFTAAEHAVFAQTSLSASEVVEKNVGARGGLQAWRAVQTMSISGLMPAGGNRRAPMALPAPDQGKGKVSAPARPIEEVQLPFVMDLKRPDRVRIEIVFNGQTAVQIFDGKNGWKLRPFLGRHEIEPYTAEEIKGATAQSALDGLLIDYAAKGTKIESEGMEKVEGQDCYKLKVILKNGNSVHDWVDARTFLEAKVDGQPRRMDGVDHPVEVYYRDYRPVNGLQMPFVIETKVLPVRAPQGRTGAAIPSEKTIIEKVELNPKFEDVIFTKASLEAKAPASAKK